MCYTLKFKVHLPRIWLRYLSLTVSSTTDFSFHISLSLQCPYYPLHASLCTPTRTKGLTHADKCCATARSYISSSNTLLSKLKKKIYFCVCMCACVCLFVCLFEWCHRACMEVRRQLWGVGFHLPPWGRVSHFFCLSFRKSLLPASHLTAGVLQLQTCITASSFYVGSEY